MAKVEREGSNTIMRRARKKLSMMDDSMDRNGTTSGNGSAASEDYNLSSDAADCSWMPPPTTASSRNNNTNGQVNGENNYLATRKKRKGECRINNHCGNNKGSEEDISPSTTTKTLFSAVMSLSNTITNPPPPPPHDDDDDDARNNNIYGAGVAATMSHYDNDATTTAKTTASPPEMLKKNINNTATTTPQKPFKGRSNYLHKSPIIMFSPGGYEILKALDGANLYAHQEHEIGDLEEREEEEEEEEDDEDGRQAEEWQDATIYFHDEYYTRKDHHDAMLVNVTATTEDLTGKIMDADKHHDGHALHRPSSIVEATKHASDFMDMKHFAKNDITIPEPVGVGVLDWSLKRRLRLECVPGRCLPQSSSSSSTSDEGFLHQLALQYLSNRVDSGRTWSQRRYSRSREDVAMAKWLASIMYYQHPAIHPLPSSMLASMDSGADNSKNNMTGHSKRDLSSFIVGPHSFHNRVRLPAAGCMGGLGTSVVVPSDRIDKAVHLGKHDRRSSSNSNKSSIATVSSLLYQRRRDWQEAFRSMFHSWKSKLKSLQDSQVEDAWSQIDEGSTTPVLQDDVSRCSFYAISPHQVILFRGGYVDGANDDYVWQLGKRDNECSGDDAGRFIAPMVVFSSTTSCFRSKLKSIGVNLRVFTKTEHDNVHTRKDCAILFSESLLDTTDNGVASTEGDAASVQSDLEVMKLENNDKEQVRVEVKKRNQHQKVGKPGNVDSPPLFVCGDDDCATVYELLMNTYGLSVGLETKLSKGGIESVPLDVPLLLCRSLGPCMHTALRTLSFSSRRDCGYLSQVQINESNFLSDGNSTAKAALELRGPILPCALRDMTCAVVNFMMLDKYTQDQSSTISHLNVCYQLPEMYGACSPDVASPSSHQFLMSLQTHEGECTSSSSATKPTGSSSSTEFNGSIPLVPKNENQSVSDPTAWSQCGHGDYVDKVVWDVSRNSVVSFHTFAAIP